MVAPEFGNWLAGFTDGEGCFDIRHNCPRGFVCRFSINLRADELEILQIIQRELGFGKIRHAKNRHHHPNTKFEITSKEGCKAICEFFTTYPLRAKKARDFEIWKKAVYEWIGTVKAGGNNSQVNSHIWSKIGRLRDDLKETRLYKEYVS